MHSYHYKQIDMLHCWQENEKKANVLLVNSGVEVPILMVVELL